MVIFRCYVFYLLVILVKLSVLAKWLARKTPLRKPNCGEGIVSRQPRLKSAHDFLGLLYYFIVLLCICVVSCPYVIYFPTVMVWYSLFVLKVPLNPKQANKQRGGDWPLKISHLRWLIVPTLVTLWETMQACLDDNDKWTDIWHSSEQLYRN